MANSGNHCTVCIKHRGLTKVSIKGCRRRPSNQKLELLVSFCGRESEKGFDQEIKPGKSIKEVEFFFLKLLHWQTNCFVLYFYMRNNTCPCPLFVPLICLKMWVEAESQQSNMLVGAGTEASEVAFGLVESGEVGGRLVFLKTEMFFKIFLYISKYLPRYSKISPKTILKAWEVEWQALGLLGGGREGAEHQELGSDGAQCLTTRPSEINGGNFFLFWRSLERKG